MPSFLKMLFALVSAALIGAMVGYWFKPSPRNPQPVAAPAANCCIRNEYDQTEAVMMSEHLFAPKYGGAELARAIIELGVDIVILTNEPWNSEAQDQALDDWGVKSLDRSRLNFVTAPHSSPWVRDFAPLFLSKDKNLSNRPLVDFAYRNDAMLDDSLSYLLAMQWRLSVNHVPVLMDGGNLMTSEGRCYAAANLTGNSSFVESFTAFKQQGCTQIELVPDDFHEHIDMFVKFVDDKTALVNAIETEALEFGRSRFEADFKSIESIAKALDQTAGIIAKTHRVIRVPTPLPILNLRRTYTNALLINKTAFVPRYRASFQLGEDYPDQKLLSGYEELAKKIYESLGFKVISFPADGMIADGGTLHCVLVQIPFRISETAELR
jgi:agmatine/peptidylarginine deiminase